VDLRSVQGREVLESRQRKGQLAGGNLRKGGGGGRSTETNVLPMENNKVRGILYSASQVAQKERKREGFSPLCSGTHELTGRTKGITHSRGIHSRRRSGGFLQQEKGMIM